MERGARFQCKRARRWGTSTIDDGTGRDSNITFEFDENGTSTTVATAPVAVGKTYNQLPDDVSVGKFYRTKEMNFFVELMGGHLNTFRNQDGGATFIDERLKLMHPFNQSPMAST